MELTRKMARSPYDTIKKVWHNFRRKTLIFGTHFRFRGQCLTVRQAKAGRMLFIELCDGSTVRSLQCIADSQPETVDDSRHRLDWAPLFDHCSRGATVELIGTIEKSPAKGQPIEFVVNDFKCLGKITDPLTYPLGQRCYLPRELLRQMPDKRGQTQLFLAIQIIKQRVYSALHEVMKELEIGEIQPTLITSNECEDGAHPFTATIILDNDEIIPRLEDGNIDWSQDFFGKRVYLTVSSQLHLEATVLSTKRDGYCMTTAFRAEPSDTTSHLAEFLMPEWELIGGGLERNMAVAQTVLQYIFRSVLEDCRDELEYLDDYRIYEKIEENPDYQKEMSDLTAQKLGKKKHFKAQKEIKERWTTQIKEQTTSLIDKLTIYAAEPFVVTTHQECVKQIHEAIFASKLPEEMMLGFEDDLSRQHEYWICQEIGGGLPVFVTHFPKKVKAFYMPIVVDGEFEKVDCYDLLLPEVGEVVGGSQRIDDAGELVRRMQELDMNLEELDWYIQLRKDASLPHGGAGLGFGRLMMMITGIGNIKDMQEFPRAFRLRCVS